MGFSVKLAPGVRVRASSRGVRTSIGPRAARMHVGSGRTGVSTGVGPVSLYSGVGGSSRRRTGTASVNRQLAAARAADKAQQAIHLADALEAITNLHRERFAQARPPVAPKPPELETGEIHRRHAREAKKATSIFARQARKQALAEATTAAEAEIATLKAAQRQQLAAAQEALNADWEALVGNDPDTVMATLAAAFEDNEAAAAAVGVAGDEVTLLVVVPAESAVPERRPGVTAAGNLSLKKMTKSDTADFYKLLVCGHTVVTVKEAFAVAPELRSARIVAVRQADADAYGRRRPEVLLAARFERQALAGIRWEQADAVQVVNDASTELVFHTKGATQALVPVDPTTEPDLAGVLAAVDFETLAS